MNGQAPNNPGGGPNPNPNQPPRTQPQFSMDQILRLLPEHMRDASTEDKTNFIKALLAKNAQKGGAVQVRNQAQMVQGQGQGQGQAQNMGNMGQGGGQGPGPGQRNPGQMQMNMNMGGGMQNQGQQVEMQQGQGQMQVQPTMQQMQAIVAAQAQAQAQNQNSPRGPPQPRPNPQMMNNNNNNPMNPNQQMQAPPQSSQVLQHMQQQPGPGPQQNAGGNGGGGGPNMGVGPTSSPNPAAGFNIAGMSNLPADVMARLIRGNPQALAQITSLANQPQAQKEAMLRLAQRISTSQMVNAAGGSGQGGGGNGGAGGQGGGQGQGGNMQGQVQQQQNQQNQSPQVAMQRLQAQVQASVQAQAQVQNQQQGGQGMQPQFTPQQQNQMLPQVIQSPAMKAEQGGGGNMQNMQVPHQGPNGPRMQNPGGMNMPNQASPRQPIQPNQNQGQGQGQGHAQGNMGQPSQGNGNNQPMNQQQFGQSLAHIIQNIDHFKAKRERNELTPEEMKLLATVIQQKGVGVTMQLQQQQQQAQQAQEQQRQIHQIRQQAAATAALQQGNFQTQALQRLSQSTQANMNMPQNLGMMNANQASAPTVMGQGGSGTGVGPMTPGQQQRVQQAIAAQVGTGQGSASSPSMMSIDSPSGFNGQVAEVALQRIEGIDAERRSKVFENPHVRNTYLRYLNNQSDEKRAEVLAKAPDLVIYLEHFREEERKRREVMIARANQASPAVTGPNIPLPNLHVPPDRQRNGNQPQRMQTPQQSLQQLQQAGLGQMGPQQNQAGPSNLQQNMMSNAKMQELLAIQASAQNQLANRQGMNMGSPASVQATPLLPVDQPLPGGRGGTPARMGSFQGGRPESLRGSPIVNNASPRPANGDFASSPANQMAIAAARRMSGPGQVPMPGSSTGTPQQQQQQPRQPMQQQQLLAEVSKHAQAQQVQANLNLQNMGATANNGGNIPGPNLKPGAAAMQISNPSARSGPTPGAGQMIDGHNPPPSNFQPTMIHSLIIPEVLTDTAIHPPAPARFIGFTRPTRLSLSNGLGAMPSVGMPVRSARPPALQQLAMLMNAKSKGSESVGSLFSRYDADESKEEVDEEKGEEDIEMADVDTASPGQVSVDEAEEETLIQPRAKRRRIVEVAKMIKKDVTISESVEDLMLQIADEFLETALETSCRYAKHRKSNKLEVRDVQFLLAQDYDIHIPGFSSDAMRSDANRADIKAAPSTHASRLAAVQAARLKKA